MTLSAFMLDQAGKVKMLYLHEALVSFQPSTPHPLLIHIVLCLPLSDL